MNEKMIKTLRDAYSDIGMLNPTKAADVKLIKFVGNLPLDMAKQLRDADINCVSDLAWARVHEIENA